MKERALPRRTSLVFTIKKTGEANQVYPFNSLTAAQTFFHDQVLGLGALPANAALNIDFDLSLTSPGGGDGLNGDLVFGVAPEPGTWVMVGLGALGLGVRVRRRAATDR